MTINFITRSDNTRLLLIFAGWSTEDDFYSDVYREGWDVAVISDYSDLTLPGLSGILDSYDTIYIIAWSLGVIAAEHLAHVSDLPYHRITAAFAVNGTAAPVSDTYGISPDIYDGTERTLTHATLRRFLNRMSSSKDKFHPYPCTKPYTDYNIDSLRQQLRNLRDLRYTTPLLPWLKAYISDNDLIFRQQSQKAYWQSVGVTTIDIPAGHYIPIQYIVHMVTPDTGKIADRFSNARQYDDYAEAQHIIARRLLSLLTDDTNCGGDILELGTGTGYFSRLLAKRLKPDDMTMVDLYMTPDMGIAPVERHIAMDAELFMAHAVTERYQFDMVASASTMQWFTDPELFIRRSARLLTESGIFLCSSFLPGNLRELDVLSPTSMPYRSEEWLKNTLSRYFKEVDIETEDIVLQFNTRRELLMHLRHTGVGGSSVETRRHWSALPEHPTLTYRPIYIRATHPSNI
ncbi:MAG: DUF452 family protein [Muribaculaceae bacterium]|nr:DUF452 family protein [Muribaculaceae bacterium]